MNKQSKSLIKQVRKAIQSSRDELEKAFDLEQDAFDDLPESKQMNEAGEAREAKLNDMMMIMGDLDAIASDLGAF